MMGCFVWSTCSQVLSLNYIRHIPGNLMIACPYQTRVPSPSSQRRMKTAILLPFTVPSSFSIDKLEQARGSECPHSLQGEGLCPNCSGLSSLLPRGRSNSTGTSCIFGGKHVRAEEEDPMPPSRMSMSYSVSPIVLCWGLAMACPPQGLLCRAMMGVVDFLSGQVGGN